MDTALALGIMLALYPLTRPYRRGDLMPSGLAIAYCGLVKHIAFVPIVLFMLGAGGFLTGCWRPWSRRELVRPAGLLVLVARSGDIPPLRAALEAMGPGVVMTPLVRTRDLQAWELSRPEMLSPTPGPGDASAGPPRPPWRLPPRGGT